MVQTKMAKPSLVSRERRGSDFHTREAVLLDPENGRKEVLMSWNTR